MERDKKGILISGGTSGIGLATVKMYLSKGYFVIINYYNLESRVSNIKKELNKLGFIEDKHYLFVRADIGNEKEFYKSMSGIQENIKDSLEVLINNAGQIIRGDINSLTQDDWLRVFQTNVFGFINTSKWFASECERGRAIVNIGSIRGFPHIARTNNIAYSVSKSVVPTLTASLAKTFGSRIRVNAILPGTIDTPQRQGIFPEDVKLYGESNSISGRLGFPNEVAELCYFITEKADYMTGSSVVLDGGYTINYIK